MKRWNPERQEYTDRTDIDLFIIEVLEVCKKYGFSISSGDYVNTLEIVDYDLNEKDLEGALDCTKGEK